MSTEHIDVVIVGAGLSGIGAAWHLLPKQGAESPWRNTQNYALDRKTIGEGPINDGILEFS